MQYINLNQQYLSFQNPNSKVLSIKSPKGSGKTRWLQDNVADGPALFLTHRVSLGSDIATRNNAAFYKNGSSAYGSERLVVSADSLMALLTSDVHKGATVVIDEASQFLRHLTGETCRLHRQEIYWTLANKVINCKQLILLDADMNQETLDFFVNLFPAIDSEDICWVNNKYAPKDKTFIEFPTNEALITSLLKDVKAGLNCYVATDTQTLSTTIATTLSSVIPADKILTVHGKNSSQPLQSQFIENPNAEQLKYQVVSASPSLATGVDICQSHFDKVYLFADNYSSTAADLLQASSRVRKVKEVSYFIAPRKRYEETDWKKLLQVKEDVAFSRYVLAATHTDRAPGTDSWAYGYDIVSGQITATHTNFIQMSCQITALDNASLNDLQTSFRTKALTEGKVIKATISEAEKAQAEKVKEATVAIKRAGKAKAQQDILNADDLTPERYELLSGSTELLSEEEIHSVEKYKLIDLVGGLSDLLPEVVANQKKYYSAVKFQGWMRKTTEELEAADEYDRLHKLPNDRSYRVKTVALIKSFLEKIGYQQSLEQGSSLIINFRNFSKDANYYFELLGLTIPSNVEEKPMQFISSVLNVLGLKAISKRPRTEQGERVRNYYIDPESVATMNSIMEAKAAKKAQAEERELAESIF